MLNYFHKSKLLVLLLLSTFALVSCAKSCKKQSDSQTASLDLYQYVPSSQNVVVEMDWKKITQVPVLAEMMKDLPPEVKASNEGMQKVILSFHSSPEAQANNEDLMLAQGQFEESKIETMLGEMAKRVGAELKKESYGKYQLNFSIKDSQTAFCLVNSHLMLWGEVPVVKRSLDLIEGKGESIAKNKDLLNSLKSLTQQNQILKAAALLKASEQPAAPNSNTNSQAYDPLASLQSLHSFSLEVLYQKDLSFFWKGQTSDPAQAQNIMNLLNGYKAIYAASLGQKDPQTASLLNSVKINQQAKNLEIQFQVPESALIEASQKIVERRNALLGGAQSQPATLPKQ